MNRSKKDSHSISSGSEKASQRQPGGKPRDSHQLSPTDEMIEDLARSMRRLSRSEELRKKVAKKAF